MTLDTLQAEDQSFMGVFLPTIIFQPQRLHSSGLVPVSLSEALADALQQGIG